MNININKNELLNNLTIVNRAVSPKSTMKILECILFTAVSDGVYLTSNDLELGIKTSKIEADVIKEGEVAIEAKILTEIVRSLPSDTINISADEKNNIKISAGSSEFKIIGFRAEEFSELPEVDKDDIYKIKATDLVSAVKQTIFSVALEETRPILTGELFDFMDENLQVVAIDGFRVSCKNVPIENNDEPLRLVIPAKTLREIIKIIDDKTEIVYIYYTARHIMFELENCIVVSRLLDGNYLSFEQLFKMDEVSQIKVNRADMASSLERACLISKEKNKVPVRLKFTDNKMEITAKTDSGTSYEQLFVGAKDVDIEIAFNPRYLLDVLTNIEEEYVYLYLSTGLNPCIIKGVEDESYKYLILPLRR